MQAGKLPWDWSVEGFRLDATPPEVLTAFLLFPEAGLGDKPGSRAEGFSTAAHLV